MCWKQLLPALEVNSIFFFLSPGVHLRADIRADARRARGSINILDILEYVFLLPKKSRPYIDIIYEAA